MNRFCTVCCAALLLVSCAPCPSPSVRLVLDGPPLIIAAQGKFSEWSGTMERSCMAGVGTMQLQNRNGTTCEGTIDHPASDKGRLHIDLVCANGDTLSIVYRNLGPDQGMGIGRVNPDREDGERITLFYHPSRDEARRRLSRTMDEIAEALERNREKDEAGKTVPRE